MANAGRQAADEARGPLEALREHFGATRILVCRSRDGTWDVDATPPAVADALYPSLLAQAPGEKAQFWAGTPDLGDPGRRLEAAGVSSVLLVGAPSGGTVVAFENADEDASSAPAGAAVAVALDAALRARHDGGTGTQDIPHILEAWIPSLERLSFEQTSDEVCLGDMLDLIGGTAAVVVRPGWERAMARAAWRHKAAFRTKRSDLGTAWRETAADPQRAVEDAAERLGIPNAKWTVGVAYGSRLILGVAGARLSHGVSVVLATSLATAVGWRHGIKAMRRNTMLEERARLASVIHEGVTQVVTNVAIEIEMLQHLLGDPERAKEMLGRLRGSVLEALDSLRGAIFELNLPTEEWTDLSRGLTHFTNDFGSQWGMSVDVELDGTQRELSPEALGLIFACVQEGLTNVRKHAGVDEAHVRISFGRDMVRASIEDRGAGYRLREGEGSGQGLWTLRRRAQLCGAKLEIREGRAGGTVLELELPD